MKTVLIGGGTGLVGARLSLMLEEKGYKVLHLSRRQNLSARFPAYAWDPLKGTIDMEALGKADVIINLAGAGIADARWTEKRKQLIIDSRVKSTRLLKTGIQKCGARPEAFISAAAVGFYGDRGEEILTEASAPGNGFLSESCVEWEKAIAEPVVEQLRTVWLRIGIVLSAKGGALEKILIPVRFGIGGYFGDGRQWYSWIHLDDLCRMFIYALENKELEGVFNAVAPAPVRNKDLVIATGTALGKSLLMIPGPEFAMRLAMGEMADTIFSSTRVSADKIRQTGFSFNFPELLPAISDLVKRKI